jgi:hypothetical protein
VRHSISHFIRHFSQEMSHPEEIGFKIRWRKPSLVPDALKVVVVL